MTLRIFVAHPSALLTDHRPHGDGLVAFGFIRELAMRGHELDVAAQAVDLRDPLPQNVRVHRVKSVGGPTALSRLDYMRRMRCLFRRLGGAEAFDVVHQLNPVDVGLSLALAGLGGPVVLGPYVPDWPPTGEGADAVVSPMALRAKRVLRRAQQQRAAMVLISTPAAASKVELQAPQGPLVREISPGVDDRAFTPCAAEATQDVLFLANLEVRKGIHVALDAFAQVAAELPAARLLVAGAGSEADAVGRRVSELPDPSRVRLLGHVEREQIQTTMRDCAVYCLPSYGEPFGMTALEAMACGKPVVATNAGGLAHLVPEAGGRKVTPGDSVALAGALRELLNDRELRRAMGEHNRRVVEQRYAWPRLVDRLEDAYREAMSASR